MKSGKIVAKHMYASQVAGLTVAPALVENQMSGALIMGASRALYEAVAFDKGRVTSLDWVTYPLLRIKDSPKVTTVPVQRLDLQATGSGEPPTAASAAAIANAFFDATGVRHPRGADDGGRVRATLKAAGMPRRIARVVGERARLPGSSARSRPRLATMEPISFAGDSLGADLVPLGGARRLRAHGARARRQDDPLLRRGGGLHAAARADRAVVRRAPVARRADERLRCTGSRCSPRRLAAGKNVVGRVPDLRPGRDGAARRPRRPARHARCDEDGMIADEIHNMLVQYCDPGADLHDPELPQPDRLDDVARRGAGGCSSSSAGRAWSRCRGCTSSRTTRTR